MSTTSTPSLLHRLRSALRKLLGRHRFDELAARLDALAARLQELSVHRDRQEETRVGILNGEIARIGGQVGSILSGLAELEERIATAATAASDASVDALTRAVGTIRETQDRIERRRSERLDAVLDAWRLEVDRIQRGLSDSVGSAARVEKNVEKLLSGEHFEGHAGEVGRRIAAMEESNQDLVRRLEDRHREWMEAQVVLQRALTDVQDRVERAWSEVERTRANLEQAEERERALADQAAHLLELLGQARRELAQVRERAEQADEARAAREDLERELERARQDLEVQAGELEDLHAAHAAFERARAAANGELERVKRERDELLLVPPGGRSLHGGGDGGANGATA